MKKLPYTLGILAITFTISCSPKTLTKVYHTGSIEVVFPDTTISFSNNAVINIEYEDLGEGTNIHFYAEQYDSLGFYNVAANFWNSGVYAPGYEYLEGVLNNGNGATIYPMMGDTAEGSYNFNQQTLVFDQVDENRVKGSYYGTYDHWSTDVPVTCNFDFTP
jgi:hypothetical protein